MNEALAVRGAFTEGVPETDDGVLVERICAAYRYSNSEFGGAGAAGESQWATINGLKWSLHEALIGGDGAAEMLRFPCTNNFFHGFDSLFASHTELLRADAARRDGEARLIASAIERLGQSTGVTRTLNPEAPDHIPPQDRSIEAILDRVSVEIGCDISFPNPFPDEFGLPTSRGVVSLRAVFAIYQAYRLKTLLPMSKDKPVLEVGAGLGRTAFYAHCMGVRHYSIVDLPLANAAQAYFLGQTVGAENISLAGEKLLAPIRILSPCSLDDLKTGIVINADSLTEMDRVFASRYVEFARDHAEIFVSINHEVNAFTANEVIRSSMPGAVVMRYPHPMRAGYIEEVALQGPCLAHR
jgi:hypothetical protein